VSASRSNGLDEIDWHLLRELQADARLSYNELSGEHCTLLKVRAASLAHLEGLVERLGKHGEMRTHIVLSTQFDRRVIEPPPPARPVTPAERWGTGR
jgi:Lrp/AsnC family leucine-responsive transcriptional regulator